jgi:AraC-like DNA-binding protein
MEYLGRKPAPPLDAYVERIWYCSDVPQHTRERVLPGGGTMDLIINLVEDEIRIFDAEDPNVVRARGGALVGGVQTCGRLCDPRQRASVAGVHFRPGGAFPFLGISSSEIVNNHVALDDVWGSRGRSLREQLQEARSASDRLRLLEAALLRRLRQARRTHPAVRVAVQALGPGATDARVSEVAAAVGLSHRRFIEVFEREVGLTPKLFARLQRFHRVKQQLASAGGPESWAAFALACGYFDQSHMIRDFVRFSGISPSSYLRSGDELTQFDHLVHAYRP